MTQKSISPLSSLESIHLEVQVDFGHLEQEYGQEHGQEQEQEQEIPEYMVQSTPAYPASTPVVAQNFCGEGLDSGTFGQTTTHDEINSTDDVLVKKELNQIVRAHSDDAINLIVLLTETSRELLIAMDSEGLATALLEAIKKDCMEVYKMPIGLKNLYTYFNEKGYKRIAMHSLQCNETMAID